ncbi:MAG: hypothetical protein ACKVZJ_12410 [Phycisphaerales bacterium]
MPNPAMRSTNPVAPKPLGPVTGALFATLLAGCASAGGCESAKFTSERTSKLTAAAESSFRIENQVGDVKVVADPSATEVTMELTFIGKGATQAKADEALNEINFAVTDPPGDTGVTARAKHPTNSGWNNKQWEVRWVVTAPPGVKIEVTDDVGEVTVVGFNNGANVSTDVGDVRIVGVMGGVTVKTEVGDATVNAQGPATVTTNVGDVRLELIGPPGAADAFKAQSDVGNVHVIVPTAWSGNVTGGSDVGSVKTSIPGLATRGDSGSGARLAGRIGSGASSTSATIKADVGSITIEQRDVARATN